YALSGNIVGTMELPADGARAGRKRKASYWVAKLPWRRAAHKRDIAPHRNSRGHPRSKAEHVWVMPRRGRDCVHALQERMLSDELSYLINDSAADLLQILNVAERCVEVLSPMHE